MRAYIVKPEPVETLEVTIGSDVYAVPLVLDVGDYEDFDFNTAEGTLGFFRKHIPNETLRTLNTKEFNALVSAWKDASEKAAGVSVGE